MVNAVEQSSLSHLERQYGKELTLSIIFLKKKIITCAGVEKFEN